MTMMTINRCPRFELFLNLYIDIYLFIDFTDL